MTDMVNWDDLSLEQKEARIRAKNRSKGLKCPKCGKAESHFVPPCLGEEGFFTCEAFAVTENRS